jgi:DNA-directed RNA polymerase specialized sigma24 family protein
MKGIHPKTLWDDDAELSRLIRAAQRESPGALDALLARVRPSFVTYFARWMVADEAEDWAQFALLKVVQTFRRIDPERVRPYLFAVARNMVREARRRRART